MCEVRGDVVCVVGRFRSGVLLVEDWYYRFIFFFFSSRRRHTRWPRDWSSDVCSSDLLIVGSHLDVPRVLTPFGERGVFHGDVAGQLPGSTFERPRARATGHAGDVFLCHPFLVHRATWPHRGTGPRIVAQPAVALHQPFALRPGAGARPVERAILRGLE